MKPRAFSFLGAAVSGGVLLPGGTVCGAVQSQPALAPQVGAYLETHCLDCHDATTQRGDFRIDNLSPKIGVENTPQWLEIMERISSGEMPPKKVKTRPTAEESARVVEWVAARPAVSYNR